MSEQIGVDRFITTRQGALALPASREDLATWSRETCVDWIRLNDPNGATTIDDDPEYPPTAAELQETIWEMLEDYR